MQTREEPFAGDLGIPFALDVATNRCCFEFWFVWKNPCWKDL